MKINNYVHRVFPGDLRFITISDGGADDISSCEDKLTLKMASTVALDIISARAAIAARRMRAVASLEACVISACSPENSFTYVPDAPQLPTESAKDAALEADLAAGHFPLDIQFF